MANVRPLNSKKYKINKFRFLELYYFCLQYNDWKEELRLHIDTVKSKTFSDMPVYHGKSDPTQELAIRRTMLEENCKLIEQTAMEVDSELYQYVIMAVTNEGITFNYLKMMKGIDCSHNTYYDRRRKFYLLLSQKKIS